MKTILNLLCYLRVVLFNMVANMNLKVALHIMTLVCEPAKYMQERKVYRWLLYNGISKVLNIADCIRLNNKAFAMRKSFH